MENRFIDPPRENLPRFAMIVHFGSDSATNEQVLDLLVRQSGSISLEVAAGLASNPVALRAPINDSDS